MIFRKQGLGEGGSVRGSLELSSLQDCRHWGSKSGNCSKGSRIKKTDMLLSGWLQALTPLPPTTTLHSVFVIIVFLTLDNEYMTQLQMFQKVEYGWGPILKVVLEC